MAPRCVTRKRKAVSSQSEKLESSNDNGNNHVAQTPPLRRSQRQISKARDLKPRRHHPRQFTSALRNQVKMFIENLEGQREAKKLYGNFGSAEWKTALLTYLNDIRGNSVTIHELTFWFRYYPGAFQLKGNGPYSSSETPTDYDADSDSSTTLPHNMAHAGINQLNSYAEFNLDSIQNVHRSEAKEMEIPRNTLPIYANNFHVVGRGGRQVALENSRSQHKEEPQLIRIPSPLRAQPFFHGPLQPITGGRRRAFGLFQQLNSSPYPNNNSEDCNGFMIPPAMTAQPFINRAPPPFSSQTPLFMTKSSSQ